METLKELKEAIANEYVLVWNDPQPISGNDYIINFIEDVNFLEDIDDGSIGHVPILIHYNNGGSEAQVFLHEISIRVEETRYARKCDITGKGMNEGWCWGDGGFYTSTEEVTLSVLRKDNPKKSKLSDDDLLEWAYDEGMLYWTTWYDEEYCEGDTYYDAEGNEYEVPESLD